MLEVQTLDHLKVLRLRIGTDPETRGPIWGSFKMHQHRDLPAGSVVKFAAVTLNKIGPREEWSCELTVEMPDGTHATSGTERPALGVDIGWRQIGGEVRVAVWRGTDGTEGELRLSAEQIEGLHIADGLRSTRDELFNEALGRLVQWFQNREMPDWMRARTVRRDTKMPTHNQAVEYLSGWKSQARLAALCRMWADHRFVDDDAAFGALEAWRHRDFHLWEYESSQRSGSLRRRKDLYRVVAKDLAEKFGTLILEDFDLRTFAKRQPKESQERENERSRSNRHMVALSEFRLCLINAFNRHGKVVWAPCRDTTRSCNVCGEVEKFNAAAERTHTCKNGHHWDQDDNAAINLTKIWIERPSECKMTRGARNEEKENGTEEMKEKRRERSKRAAAERKSRLGTARDSASM